jgi:membrane dipeptidase
VSTIRNCLIIVLAFTTAGCAVSDPLKIKANELAQELFIIDTHQDVPYQLEEKYEDISKNTSGDFDYPRARKGGLDAVFMAAYVPPGDEEKNIAKAHAEMQINMIKNFAEKNPDKFEMVRSVAELRSQPVDEKVSLLIAIENGSALESKLDNLKYFQELGVCYITLTHSKNNSVCDSSFDETVKWQGLSPFGKEVVAEMNRLGMIVDISHVSDKAFYQVLEISEAPVAATHSACRHFTPGMERNMSDEMIKALAEKGGVIQINFGGMFINTEVNKNYTQRYKDIDVFVTENNPTDEERREFIRKYKREHPLGKAQVCDVADHIDHVVQLVGIDHVGLGSDFDGVGEAVPVGLEDVSAYPNLIYELLKRGYTEEDIKKICSENFLRVWAQVEETAQRLQSDK